jgi:hypothetical protein
MDPEHPGGEGGKSRRARLYLSEARELVASGKRLTAEQAYFDAIEEAYACSARDACADTGTLFAANARLAELYASCGRGLEAQCCAHETLMLAHRTFTPGDIQRQNQHLQSALKEMECIYIGHSSSSSSSGSGSSGEASGGRQWVYSGPGLRALRVELGLFPSRDTAPAPAQLDCYARLRTFRYHRDIRHYSLELHQNKTRKNRGGVKRSRKLRREEEEEQEEGTILVE